MSSAKPPGEAPVALVDLGDTLAECTPALRDGLARLRHSGERAEDEELMPLPPHLEERQRAVMSAPGFWRGLAPRAAGFELLALLREAGFRPCVVTKGPYGSPDAWADKVAWCRTHLPDVPVIVTDDKALIHGDVLVDDWLPYVEHWQRRWPHGFAIVPAQPWNADAPCGPQLVRDDGRRRDGVLAALGAWRRAGFHQR